MIKRLMVLRRALARTLLQVTRPATPQAWLRGLRRLLEELAEALQGGRLQPAPVPVPRSARPQRRVPRASALLLVLLLTAGCSMAPAAGPLTGANVVAALSGEPDAAFARALEPRPLLFPADHGAHPEYQTEWWYYTGNLEDDQGNRYGYQFTIFRSALTPEMVARDSTLATNQVYMGHFAVTDAAGNRHVSFERFSRGAGGLAGAVGEPSFHVWLEDWEVTQPAPDRMRMVAADVDADGQAVALALELRQTRPPVSHGVAGLSQKGPEPGNASYYYSLIGLETTGTLTLRGRTIPVRGVSWMDHEFGTSALSENAVGWDWFSIQLDNGAALMFAQIRSTDGPAIGEFEGTFIHADDRQETVTQDDFSLTVLEQWTSPRTGITYPSGWRVVLPRYDLELTVMPILRDQEMQVTYMYWEGAVTVAGTLAGTAINGVGYVELTGYGAGHEFQR